MKRAKVYKLRSLIEKAAQSLADCDALEGIELYPEFTDIIGRQVEQGFKFRHNDKLWKVVQPELIVYEHYPPGAGTESMYEEICETSEGTFDNPIPYSGNMALENGKFYIQYAIIYECIRDSGNAVYHPLSALVGLYVEVAA